MDPEGHGSDETGPHRATFIVRLTRERRAGATWRGEVEFLQVGERRAVGDPGSALALVTAWLHARGSQEERDAR